MEKIINILINSLNNTNIGKEIIVFIISLFPILELRGGMIAASILNVSYKNAIIASVIGNILPIPFILLLMEKILLILDKNKITKNLSTYIKNLAIKSKPKVDKYGFFGLVLFVGIPLPGTGAWTGALVASLFHYDKKKSIIAILLGIILALAIMLFVSYGIIGSIKSNGF